MSPSGPISSWVVCSNRDQGKLPLSPVKNRLSTGPPGSPALGFPWVLLFPMFSELMPQAQDFSCFNQHMNLGLSPAKSKKAQNFLPLAVSSEQPRMSVCHFPSTWGSRFGQSETLDAFYHPAHMCNLPTGVRNSSKKEGHKKQTTRTWKQLHIPQPILRTTPQLASPAAEGRVN